MFEATRRKARVSFKPQLKRLMLGDMRSMDLGSPARQSRPTPTFSYLFSLILRRPEDYDFVGEFIEDSSRRVLPCSCRWGKCHICSAGEGFQTDRISTSVCLDWWSASARVQALFGNLLCAPRLVSHFPNSLHENFVDPVVAMVTVSAKRSKHFVQSVCSPSCFSGLGGLMLRWPATSDGGQLGSICTRLTKPCVKQLALSRCCHMHVTASSRQP